MPDNDLPLPPLPVTVDLRIFRRMPLDVMRVRDSETIARTDGDEFKAAFLLWCAAWHQLPASSLPDDDVLLASLAGYGRVVREWRKVRERALRGFVKCSDGRLYHAVIADIALDSWGAHLKQRWKSECGRTKKALQRAHQEVKLPTFDLWITRTCPEAKPFVSRWTRITSPEDLLNMSPGQDADVPGKTAPREGKGSESSSINQLTGDGSTSVPAVPGTARAKPGKSKPQAAKGSTEWEARVKAEGAGYGMAPGVNESWDAFASRVRAERDKRKHHEERAA